MLFTEAFTDIAKEMTLTIASNGDETLQLLRNCDQPPNLIILDYNMPFLSGLDVLRIMQNESLFTDVPKVMLSTSPHIVEACTKAGALECFTKPSTTPELYIVVHKILQYAKLTVAEGL